MFKSLAIIMSMAAAAFAFTGAADAKGCLKGAAVGGVAGRYAGHHGFLGAAAGLPHRPARSEEKRQTATTEPEPERATLRLSRRTPIYPSPLRHTPAGGAASTMFQPSSLKAALATVVALLRNVP